MNAVKKELIDIFKPSKYDWMNFKIEDEITYHHIVKAEDGGKCSIDNGALLTPNAHQYLHKIEVMDKDIYDRINAILKEINLQHKEPTKYQRMKIQLLMMKFEIDNVDRIIKKKERIDKSIRKKVAIERRLKKQQYE